MSAAAARRFTSIPVPPELPPELLAEYLAQVAAMVDDGADPEQIARQYSKSIEDSRAAGLDPFDPTLHETVVEGTAADAIRFLEGDHAESTIAELRREGSLCDSSI